MRTRRRQKQRAKQPPPPSRELKLMAGVSPEEAEYEESLIDQAWYDFDRGLDLFEYRYVDWWRKQR